MAGFSCFHFIVMLESSLFTLGSMWQVECCVRLTLFGMELATASLPIGQPVCIRKSWPTAHAVLRMASMTGRATRAGKASATAMRAMCPMGHLAYSHQVNIIHKGLCDVTVVPHRASSDADRHSLFALHWNLAASVDPYV
jgi:hypothetical protein